MGATLTAPDTVLSHFSAAAAYGTWGLPRELETVSRPGSGGPRRHGSILVYRSDRLAGETTELDGIPITTFARTVLDLAPQVSERALAWLVREGVRLGHVTVSILADCLGRHRGRRGARRVSEVIARYTGLPLERARSGAEVRAMEVLKDGQRPLPELNVRVAGEEADLVWRSQRLVIEIDGEPFHQDVGNDARKQAAWERAGWTVKRLPSDAVYKRPSELLALAPPSNVPESTL